ncbi:MAG: hypothetical protein KGS60_03225 [Verrucomicrobia bacterium]|nr:hypothetical protein [Verrucomicrobiota bacterium]
MKEPRHTENKSSPDAPLSEETDGVWQLLAKSPPHPAPPWFVLRTVRAAREEPAISRMPLWWAHAWAPATLIVTLGLILRFTLPLPVQPRISEESRSTELLREELHLMTYVDELLTVSDPATLDDAGLAELF